VLKLIIIHLLTNWDFKYSEKCKTLPTPDMIMGMMKGLDISMKDMFKDKIILNE
jgi:hypothetical protein